MSPNKTEKTTSRKEFKHARYDGNLIQRVAWRALNPPVVPAQRVAGRKYYSIISRLLFTWPAHLIWVSVVRQVARLMTVNLLIPPSPRPLQLATCTSTTFRCWMQATSLVSSLINS